MSTSGTECRVVKEKMNELDASVGPQPAQKLNGPTGMLDFLDYCSAVSVSYQAHDTRLQRPVGKLYQPLILRIDVLQCLKEGYQFSYISSESRENVQPSSNPSCAVLRALQAVLLHVLTFG